MASATVAAAVAPSATGSSALLTPVALDESPVRRFETVFFITLPFTGLYSSLAVVAAGYAIEGKRFTVRGPYLAAAIALPLTGSGWIAWRDQHRPPERAIVRGDEPQPVFGLQSDLSPR